MAIGVHDLGVLRVLFWATTAGCCLAQLGFLVGAFRQDVWVGLASLIPPLGWGLAFAAPASARQRAWATAAIVAFLLATGVGLCWVGLRLHWIR